MSLYQPEVSVTKPTETVTIESDGLMVHQGVSPNGDGINDVLTIDGITAYPNNHLTIIDRSGSLIFQAKGYDNSLKAFDGHSNLNGRMQQPGTYFYSLDYIADGQTKHKTGYILLKY
jgi:gliding motility-associated-like protein